MMATHPNRETAAAQATRAAVVVLLLASALLMVVVAAGGWSALAGQRVPLAAYAIAYVGLAVLAARWTRGILPVAATLAVLLGILAAVAAPGWFARTGDGFADPGLGNGLLGLLTSLLIPIQVLLIACAARGFAQNWHVEVDA
jgi:hypothetical protein